jgi:hypothetical protein
MSTRFCFRSSAFGKPIARTTLAQLSPVLAHGILFAIICWEMRRASLITSSARLWWSSAVVVRGLLLRCLSFRLACPRSASRTCLAQRRTIGYWCPHERLSLSDECQSIESFLQSKTESLHSVYSALTSSPYHFDSFNSETTSGRTSHESVGKSYWMGTVYFTPLRGFVCQKNFEHYFSSRCPILMLGWNFHFLKSHE